MLPGTYDRGREHYSRLLRHIGGAQAAALVVERTRRARLDPRSVLAAAEVWGCLMQVEERQLDVDQVPGLGVQPLCVGPSPASLASSTNRSYCVILPP